MFVRVCCADRACARGEGGAQAAVRGVCSRLQHTLTCVARVQGTVGATFAAAPFTPAATSVGSSMSLAVDSAYISSLGDINGDGTLTPAEIAAGKF